MTLLDRIIDDVKRGAELLRAFVHIEAIKIEATADNIVFGPLTDAQIDKLFTTRAAMTPGGAQLDWKHSIVDRLKVLGWPSDLQARKEIAQNLGWSSSDKVDGSAESNTRLNDALMAAIRHRLIVPGPVVSERE